MSPKTCAVPVLSLRSRSTRDLDPGIRKASLHRIGARVKSYTVALLVDGDTFDINPKWVFNGPTGNCVRPQATTPRAGYPIWPGCARLRYFSQPEARIPLVLLEVHLARLTNEPSRVVLLAAMVASQLFSPSVRAFSSLFSWYCTVSAMQSNCHLDENGVTGGCQLLSLSVLVVSWRDRRAIA